MGVFGKQCHILCICINYWYMDLHLYWLWFLGESLLLCLSCVTCVSMPGCSFSWAFSLKGLSLFPGAVIWPWYQFLVAPCHHPHCQEMHHSRVPEQPDLRCGWAHQSHLLLWPHWGLLDACTEYIQQTGNYQLKSHRKLKGHFWHCYLSIKEVYICLALTELHLWFHSCFTSLCNSKPHRRRSLKAVAFQWGVTVRQSKLCLGAVSVEGQYSGWWFHCIGITFCCMFSFRLKGVISLKLMKAFQCNREYWRLIYSVKKPYCIAQCLTSAVRALSFPHVGGVLSRIWRCPLSSEVCVQQLLFPMF